MLFHTDSSVRMADRHASGDGRNGFNGSPPDLKVEIANGSTKGEKEDKNLWPR